MYPEEGIVFAESITNHEAVCRNLHVHNILSLFKGTCITSIRRTSHFANSLRLGAQKTLTNKKFTKNFFEQEVMTLKIRLISTLDHTS